MNDFIAYCKEYWLYLIVLAVLIVAFVFVFRRARKAYRDYYRRYRAEEARMKRLVSLKERYSSISAGEIAACDENELLEGLALSYQLKLQKEDDMEAAFADLNPQKQYVYVLDIFMESESASDFFRRNGRELTEIIVPAMEYFGLEEEAERAEKLRIMFDDRDETTSISASVIDENDAFFSRNEERAAIRLAAGRKIKEDADCFKVD